MSSVQFNPPTIEMQETILNKITPYFEDVKNHNKKGGLFTVLTKDSNGLLMGNAVVAVRVGDKVELAGYIGKTWGAGPVVYGVEAKFYF